MELSQTSQSLLYQGVRKTKSEKEAPRTSTATIIRKILDDVEKINKRASTEAQLWKSIRNRAIRKPITDFLWLSIHGAHKTGSFWEKIPNMQERAEYPKCKVTEDMEHILTACKATGQELIWKCAKELWTKKGGKWPKMSFGAILGNGLIPFPFPQKKKGDTTTSNGTTKRKRPKAKAAGYTNGDKRLFTIIVTESAYLIWKLRNERRIKHNDNPDWEHAEEDVKNKWFQSLDVRLRKDQYMTKERNLKKDAIEERIVENTWSKILQNEESLPEDWIRKNRVLVGRGRPPDPQGSGSRGTS